MNKWRYIPGYEGLYMAAPSGEIMSMRKGWVLSPAIMKGRNAGYLRVCLSKGTGQRLFNVHTLIALTFLGPCPAGLEVCHKNGIRGDCSRDNLYYGTHTQNMRDAVTQGKIRSGEAHYQGVHTEDLVRRIRKRMRTESSNVKLAKEFNLTRFQVASLRGRTSWKHIQ